MEAGVNNERNNKNGNDSARTFCTRASLATTVFMWAAHGANGVVVSQLKSVI